MDRLRTIVEDPRTERVIMSLIIINAVILGLETSRSAMASFGSVLEALDHLILAVFVIEIAARIAVHRLGFFRDPWSVFDFLVVGIALVPATETFSVLRALEKGRDPLTLSELAGALCCVRSNVTQLVDRLEADGFVIRVDDPSDRRSIRATLTTAGRGALYAGYAAYESVERAVFVAVDGDERGSLVRLLNRIG